MNQAVDLSFYIVQLAVRTYIRLAWTHVRNTHIQFVPDRNVALEGVWGRAFFISSGLGRSDTLQNSKLKQVRLIFI